MRALVRVFVASWMVFAVGTWPGEAPAPPPAGLVPPSPVEKEWLAKNAVPATPPDAAKRDALPARVVNIAHLPPVGRQIIGSCTSWATAYYMKGYQEAREQGWTRPNLPAEARLSPAFTYNFVRASETEGSSFEANIGFLLRHGTSTFDAFPETGDVSAHPSVELWKDAARRRGASVTTFAPSTPEGIDTARALLADGNVLTTGMSVYANFDAYYYYGSLGVFIDNEVLYAPDTQGYRAEHALCVIGYDDGKTYFNGTETRSGAFLIVNSWGTGWGVSVPESGGERGYIWVAYDYFLNGYGRFAWPFYAVEDRTGYEPKAFAILDFEHPTPVELGMILHGGRSDSPEAKDTQLISHILHMRDIVMASDITDIFDPEIETWTLRVMDYYVSMFGTVSTGVMRDFAMDLPGQPRRHAPGTPVHTEDFVPSNPVSVYDLPVSLFTGSEVIGSCGDQGSLGVADWDGDGDLDLVSGGELLRNDGGAWTAAGTVAPGYWSRCAFGDYDADGLPDLAVFGNFNDNWGLRVLRNLGNGVFREDTFFPEYDGSTFAHVFWIDWDRDGRLDLMAGNRVHRNLGHGLFEDMGITLPDSPRYTTGPVDADGDGDWDLGCHLNNGDGTWTALPWDAYTEVAWGDYDADGRPDAAVSAVEWVLQPGGSYLILPFLHVWRNEGGGMFTSVARLPSAQYCTPTWADINNDGRLDLLATGINSSGGYVTTHTAMLFAWCQRADGSFHDVAPACTPLGWGPLAAADFDGDGDADLVYGGSPTNRFGQRELRFAPNLCVEETARPNATPSVPGGVALTAGTLPGQLTLTWERGTDDLTAGNQMRHEIRVGTAAGLGDVVGPRAGTGSTPLVLAGGAPGFRFRELPAGTFHASVRAVDTAGSASAWSAEVTGTVAQGNAPAAKGDANRDGVLDAADIVVVRRMASGAATPDAAVGDTNFDGLVTTADVPPLARALAGAPIARMPEGVLNVGREGGTVTYDNITVTIPPDAFTGGRALVRIEPMSEHPFGWNGVIGTGEMRLLSGIPEGFAKPLQVKVRDNRGNPSYLPEIVLSEPGFAPSRREAGDFHRRLPVSMDTWPDLEFTIEPIAEAGAKRSDVEGTYSFGIGVLGGYSEFTTAHFRIAFPSSFNSQLVEDLAGDLEDAHARFSASDIGFSYARRTRWPMDVTLKVLENSVYGFSYNSIRGDNHGGLEFNTDRLADGEGRRATAFHEFMHQVQSWHDPRNRFSKAKFAAPHYLLDEAVAVWAEGLGAADPGSYRSSVMLDNWTAPFAASGWFLPSDASNATVQGQGYGFASVVRFLERKRGASAARRMYEEIAAGRSWVYSVALASEDTTFFWLPQFYSELLAGSLYAPPDANTFVTIPTGKRSLRLAAGTESKVVEEEVAPLSARLYMAYAAPDFVDFLRPGHSIGLRLEGTTDTSLAALASATDVAPAWLGSASILEGISRLRIPNAQQLLTQPQGRLLALVTNDAHGEPPEPATPVKVTMALLEDMTLAVPAFTQWGSYNGYPFPSISPGAGASVTIPSATSLGMDVYDPIGVHIRGLVWEDEDRTVDVRFPVLLGSTSLTDEQGVTYTASGVEEYRLSVLAVQGDTAYPVSTQVNATGDFSVPAVGIDGLLMLDMRITYRVSAGGQEYVQEWPVMFLYMEML